MAKVFIFGASIAYGVGGEEGGWGDLLKRKIHLKMYGNSGIGEKHQVYNFGKPGATVEFALDTFSYQLDKYADDQKAIAIVSVGINNTRAKEKPDNFVSNIEDYRNAMTKLLKSLKQKVNYLICVGYSPVDESKTTPKPNPLTGGFTYFFNNRIQEFNDEFKRICKEEGVKFIDIDINPQVWIEKFLWDDGLHPNKLGHQLIFENVWLEVKSLL